MAPLPQASTFLRRPYLAALLLLLTTTTTLANHELHPRAAAQIVDIDAHCPGYTLTPGTLTHTAHGLTAQLHLAGNGKNCDDVYGKDIRRLKLEAIYEDSALPPPPFNLFSSC